jgi:hypothetical protein
VICQDEMTEHSITLCCNHEFHLTCIAKYEFEHFWKHSTELSKCPLCRETIGTTESVLVEAPFLNLSELCELKDFYNQCFFKWIIREFTDADDDELEQAMKNQALKHKIECFAQYVSHHIQAKTRDMRSIPLQLKIKKVE